VVAPVLCGSVPARDATRRRAANPTAEDLEMGVIQDLLEVGVEWP
jgi:hypothetical protein